MKWDSQEAEDPTSRFVLDFDKFDKVKIAPALVCAYSALSGFQIEFVQQAT